MPLDPKDPLAKWEDDIYEAIQDAISDSEGLLTPYYLLHHLRKKDMTIVELGDETDAIMKMSEEQVKALALRYDTAEEAVRKTHQTELKVKETLAEHDKKRLEAAREIFEALAYHEVPLYLRSKEIMEWLSYYGPPQPARAERKQ